MPELEPPMPLLRSCRLFCAAFFLAAASTAFGAQRFTLEQAMSAPFASELVAAPRGDGIAWIENQEGRRNVWVASGPDWKARKATAFDQDDGQEIGDLAWAPDAGSLLFARGGDFENGGENPNPNVTAKKPEQAIWRVAVDGSAPSKLADGHAPQISSANKVVFLRGTQILELDVLTKAANVLVEGKGTPSRIRWAPDGSSFVFVSGRRDHSFIGVYRLTDKTLRYLDASVDRDADPVWSPDGAQIAFVRIPAASRPAFFSPQREAEPWSIRVVDLQAGKARQVFCAARGSGSLFREVVADQQIFWSGNRLVFPWERTGWLHLYSIPVNGGTFVELTPGEGEVEHVAASHDGKTIEYSTNTGDTDRRHLWRVNADGTGKPKPMTGGESSEWSPRPTADGSATAYLTSSVNEASHVSLRLTDGRTFHPASDAGSDGFPAGQFVKPQAVLLTAADGMQIHGQLFLPPSSASQTHHPALVFFHGGSRRQMLLGFHYMYYYSNAYAMNQYLASQGYVVLAVNYRSGIGYGLNFREAVNYGARGASEFNDVIGAGLYLRARPDVDAQRIGVWGGSYGGYLTAMALSRASDLFAAGVDFHGVHDWSSLRGYLNGGLLSGDPKDLRERQEAARIAFASSPMATVDTWRSPVLLIHGDDDRNVEFSQTVMLVEALRKRNVSFEELIFPNEIHDFLLHRHWVEAYQATANFFARKLCEPMQSTDKRTPSAQ